MSKQRCFACPRRKGKVLRLGKVSLSGYRLKSVKLAKKSTNSHFIKIFHSTLTMNSQAGWGPGTPPGAHERLILGLSRDRCHHLPLDTCPYFTCLVKATVLLVPSQGHLCFQEGDILCQGSSGTPSHSLVQAWNPTSTNRWKSFYLLATSSPGSKVFCASQGCLSKPPTPSIRALF